MHVMHLLPTKLIEESNSQNSNDTLFKIGKHVVKNQTYVNVPCMT